MIEVTDKVREALATLEANRPFCDLGLSVAISNILDAFEHADNVNISGERNA